MLFLIVVNGSFFADRGVSNFGVIIAYISKEKDSDR